MYLFKYILKRIGLMLLSVMVIFTMCFVLVKLLPNTPEPQPGKDYDIIMRRREMLGYDKPIMEQYWYYWFGRTGYTYDKMENVGTIRREGMEFTQRLNFSVDGAPTENGIKLSATNKGSVAVFATAMSIGDEAKTLTLYNSEGKALGDAKKPTVVSKEIAKISFDIPSAGDYYLVGGSHINIYYVELTTNATEADGEPTVVGFNFSDLTETKLTATKQVAEGISVVATESNPATLAANGNKVQYKEGDTYQWVTQYVYDENGEQQFVKNDEGDYLDRNGYVTTNPDRYVPVTEVVLDENGQKIPVYATVTVYDKEKIDDYATGITKKASGGIIRGNFGVSEVLYKGSDVWDIFAEKVPFTVAINLYSIFLSIPLGLLLGIYAALRKNKWQDHVISTGVMIFVSVPSFIYAFLVHYVLYFKLGWTPFSANAKFGPWSWVFFTSTIGATLSMSFGTIAGFARYTRAELTEVLTSEFMLLARTKGLTKAQAVVRHALKNAMVVIFPMILGEFISIMSGSLIIEQIFGIPGVGPLYIKAIQAQPTPDYNIFMLLTGFYTLIGLAAGIVIDISYGIIDPRIRMGAR